MQPNAAFESLRAKEGVESGPASDFLSIPSGMEFSAASSCGQFLRLEPCVFLRRDCLGLPCVRLAQYLISVSRYRVRPAQANREAIFLLSQLRVRAFGVRLALEPVLPSDRLFEAHRKRANVPDHVCESMAGNPAPTRVRCQDSHRPAACRRIVRRVPPNGRLALL